MLKAPGTFRELVFLFGRLEPGGDAASLFARVDWAGVTPAQLIHVFLDRPPAHAQEALGPAVFDPAREAEALFYSAAFREGIIERVLHQFPGRRRLLFVHLPKTAGTDFVGAMVGAFPHISQGLPNPERVTVQMLPREFRRLARKLPESDSLFLGGHLKLGWFLDQGLYRFGDRLMTIVRHPHEICVSFANYVLKCFGEDPGLERTDTRGWAGALGLTAEAIAGMDPRNLAISLVARPHIQPVNPLCDLLGDRSARVTLDNLARAPIEITTRSLYSAWLQQEWGITREKRLNASPQLIGWDDLSGWQKSQIEAGCQEDMVIFEAITALLERKGGLSVTGPEVARYVLGRETVPA